MCPPCDSPLCSHLGKCTPSPVPLLCCLGSPRPSSPLPPPPHTHTDTRAHSMYMRGGPMTTACPVRVSSRSSSLVP